MGELSVISYILTCNLAIFPKRPKAFCLTLTDNLANLKYIVIVSIAKKCQNRYVICIRDERGSDTEGKAPKYHTW